MGKELLSEAVCLWIATAVVVAIASVVHYAIASSERRGLKQRIDLQKSRQQPDDFKRSIPGAG